MAFSRSTGVTQQVTDFSSAPLSDILIHRGVVGRRRLNHPQHFAVQVLSSGWLTAALKQFGQLDAERGNFAVMLNQATIATGMQDGQRIDRAIEGQFAPQPGEDVRGPFVGDTAVMQLFKPGRWRWIPRVAQPGVAMACENHLPILLTKRAFGTRREDTARLGDLCGDGILAAQPVLQQHNFRAGAQPWRQRSNRLLGVVSLAGQQQAVDGLIAVEGLGTDRQSTFNALLHQGQRCAVCLVGRQSRSVTQDQPYRQTGSRKTRGPQATQASGAQDMPGHRHQLFTARQISGRKWGKSVVDMERSQ